MIYFIRNNSSGSVKIGWSDKPKKRLKTLQIGHEDLLVLEAAVEADRSSEHRLHLDLAARRLNGEWFKGGGIVDRLVDACRIVPTLREALLALGQPPDLKRTLAAEGVPLPRRVSPATAEAMRFACEVAMGPRTPWTRT